jgi:lactam utilization protein B
MMAALGLKDDYQQDGRVVSQFLDTSAVSQTMQQNHETLLRLGAVYKQVMASFGQFSHDTLVASTRALAATDANTYTTIENQIMSLTNQRNSLASEIRSVLYNAAFNNQAASEQQLESLIARATRLLARSGALAAG